MATAATIPTLMKSIWPGRNSSPTSVPFAKGISALRNRLSVPIKSGLLKMVRYAFARLVQTRTGRNVPMVFVGSVQKRMILQPLKRDPESAVSRAGPLVDL